MFFGLLIVAIGACAALSDSPAPPESQNVLALVARSYENEARVQILEPESLSFVRKSSVDVKVDVASFDGTFLLFLNETEIYRKTLALKNSRETITRIIPDLADGQHRIYVILRPSNAQRALEASAQFYVLSKSDPEEIMYRACVSDERFSIGINAPCDGIFQTGHELRLAGKLEEAIPYLLHTVQWQSQPIAYAFVELALVFLAKGDKLTAVKFMQIVERLYPGYIPARHPKFAPRAGHANAITIDLRDLERETLEAQSHLMCLWSGMIITRHAGIRKGVGSALHPGNHYKLLKRIGKQIQGKTIIELGTLHAAATIALAADGKNKVVSFNVLDDLGSNVDRCGISKEEFKAQVPGELEFLIADATSEEYLERLSEAEIIFIDTNHHGDIEDRVYQYLAGVGWEGILILDDIFLNQDMDGWWGTVTHPKYDLTDWGHTASGTGIVDFANRLNFVL